MKLRLLPLLLFIGAVGILWLLSARRADGAEGPWSVYSVMTSSDHANVDINYEKKFNRHCEFQFEEQCEDFVDAMNEAHERRHQHKINVTCKEISHTFMDCENIESDDPGSGLRPEK